MKSADLYEITVGKTAKVLEPDPDFKVQLFVCCLLLYLCSV